MQDISEIIKKKSLTADHRNKYEFQAFGNRLADELGDNKHRALYIKLAKTENRGLLEIARAHALETDKIKEKGKLFMWKLTELKKEKKLKNQSK